MLIVADQNIPQVEEAFSTLGRVRLVDGRHLRPEEVADAEVLLVRSVTRVDEVLLAGTAVRFVGSATSGIDHIDRDCLAARSIDFAYAPGVNAQAVAEYVVSALFTLSGHRPERLVGKTLGVVGYGQVGRRAVRMARVLGLECLINDPPLEDAGNDEVEFHSLEEIAKRADIVSLHVPLNVDGPYRSRHLVDAAMLSTMRPDAWLINTARGAVLDNNALRETLCAGRLKAVLDVWEGEPDISLELLKRVALGTPHIAGYSVEGKYNATGLLYRQVCARFNLEPAWNNTLPGQTETVDLRGLDPSDAVARMVDRAYDIAEDDARLRELIDMPLDRRPVDFDQLRADYPVRREFTAWPCIPPDDEWARLMLERLGFVCVST